MSSHWLLLRITPIVASLLLHVVAYGAIAMVPKFTSVRERVLIADLIEPDPAPTAPPPAAPPKAPPRPKAADLRPLTPPKPMETPLPALKPPPVDPPVEAAPPPPPPPPPVVQEAPLPKSAPAPAPTPAPAVAAAPSATAPADVPATTTSDALPKSGVAGASAPPISWSPPASSPLAGATESAGKSVAALPPDGVTRTAVPRGSYQVRPSYPSNARRLGIQGTTVLSVFVAADGRVGDVVVKQSAGHPDLDNAAAEAVKRWRFEPARRGNEAVSMWVLQPIEFRLH
jgi:protein TonB